MNENELNIFINGIKHYFQQISDSQVDIQTPYLKENSDPLLTYEYTGIIGISGRYKGCVYFSAPKNLLKQLLVVIKESDSSHDNLCDLVGEIANTISGNARTHFGPDFMISVPIVVSQQPDQIKLPKDTRSFIIPIKWRTHDSALVISVE